MNRLWERLNLMFMYAPLFVISVRQIIKQTWNLVKDFAYVHYGRKVMNRNVSRIRQLAG